MQLLTFRLLLHLQLVRSFCKKSAPESRRCRATKRRSNGGHCQTRTDRPSKMERDAHTDAAAVCQLIRSDSPIYDATRDARSKATTTTLLTVAMEVFGFGTHIVRYFTNLG